MRFYPRKILLVILFVICHSSFVISQPISITFKDSTRGLIHVDSSNWEEAWIEVNGLASSLKPLTTSDFLVHDSEHHADVLSVDSIGAKYGSHLALSVVLDNSGSMFHNYDSLTKFCDSLILSLSKGVHYQVVVFDNILRTSKHLATRRSNVFIAQSGFTDSEMLIRSFWHFYDSVRTQYTPLYDAMTAAIYNIDDRRLIGRDSSDHVLLIVTDGTDNASRTSIEMLAKLLDASHLRLFAVNYRTEDSRLEWLVRKTNGVYYLADNLNDLRTILHDVSHLLSRQYYIRYRFPTLGPSGAPRNYKR